MKARVRTTYQAETQALAVEEWWRANRQASPDLFARELAGALSLLADAPAVGRRYPAAGIPGLRRLMLPASRYHVYYVHDSTEGEVIILAIWSAVRGSGPKLMLP